MKARIAKILKTKVLIFIFNILVDLINNITIFNSYLYSLHLISLMKISNIMGSILTKPYN